MSTTRMLLGRSAAPHTLEHKGRVYEFRALGQIQRTAFEAWLIERTRETIKAVYEAGTERVRQLEALKLAAISGEYDFTGELAQRVAQTPTGAVKLASILMDCTVDEAVLLYSERGDDVRHLLELAVAESSVRREKQEEGGPEGNAQKVREETG